MKNQAQQKIDNNLNQSVVMEQGQHLWVREIKHQNKESDDETTATDDDILVGIIITTRDGSSYDELFEHIPQESKEGERVTVYSASSSAWVKIAEVLSNETPIESLGEDVDDDFKQLIQDMRNIDADSTVFNFECCSGCSDIGFSSIDEPSFLKAVRTLLDRGHMMMFSDFSLKALIAKWDEELFGPNPFIQIGEFSDTMEIKFSADDLKNCPSTQLAKVGELCPDGGATIHCLGGTIAYTVDKVKADHQKYTLDVLTVATRLGSFNFQSQFVGNVTPCNIGDYTGCAGHVLITYPSGGKILTSCGHWIELVKLDTNMESLLAVAQNEYGDQMYNSIQNEYMTAKSDVERSSIRQKYAQRMIQSSAPSKKSEKLYRKKK